jgi:hypothetical protein
LGEPAPPEHAGEREVHVLEAWGFTTDDVTGLMADGVLV